MTNTDVTGSREWAELAAELAAEPDVDKRRALVDEMHAAYLAAPSPLAGTTAGGLPYPAPTDPIAQGADAIRALAEAVDVPRLFDYWLAAVSYTLTAAYANIPNAAFTVPVKAGQKYTIVASLNVNNAASGNPKSVGLRLMENGVLVGTAVSFSSPFIVGSTANTMVIRVTRTAAADANLAYQVQGMCNAASSCTVIDCELSAINTPAAATRFSAVDEAVFEDVPPWTPEAIAENEAALASERAAAGVE